MPPKPEIKSTAIIPPVVSLKPYRSRQKRWKLARSDYRYQREEVRNSIIERNFMSFLDQVKELYQGTGTVAFELDQRHDRRFNCTGMHTFCTPDLYLELECAHDLNCYVSYDFNHCRYKDQILQLSKDIYPSDADAVRCLPLQGGVLSFYQRVKLLHPATCFTVL